MNIASALLKQVVIQQDLDTWSQVKEIYLPKLEQDEGIISYGAFESSKNTLVLFEFWTSHDAKHSFDEKLNADENVYEKFMPLMEGFTDYYGEPYAIRQFVDFKAGESIN